MSITRPIQRHRRLIEEGGLQALKRQVSEDHVYANRADQDTAEAIIEHVPVKL